jgi:hypothetical protein
MSIRGLFIPTRFDLRQARQDLGELKQLGRQAGTEAGTATGAELLKSLRAEMNQKVAAAREALTRGLIDRQQFRKISQDAAREFNAGILRSLEEMRRQGKAGTDEFVRMQRALRHVGTTGTQAGDQVRRGFVDSLRNLPGLIRGGIAAGIVASFTYVANQVIAVFRRIATTIHATLQEASRAALLGGGFQHLATRAGLDPDVLLSELRRATRGLVADVELYRLANRALQSEIPLTAQQMAALAEVARRSADMVGGDATQAFDTLINAIARGRTVQMTQIGLFVDQRKALQDWERQTGRTQSSLTDMERRTIFLNATLEEANRLLAQMGRDALTPGERIQQLGTAWSNLKTAIALAIADSPRVISFLDGIGDSAEHSAGRIEQLADRVGALVDTLLEARRGLAGLAGAEGLFSRFPFNIIARGNVRITEAMLGFDREAFGENLARREREREIRAETDLQKLLERRVEILTELIVLRAEGADDDDRRVQALRRENDLIQDRVRQLERLGQAPGRPGPSPEDEAAAAAAAAAAEAAAKRNAEARLRLERQVQDQLTRLTLDATDQQLRALTQLEDEYRAAGGRIEGEFGAAMERLRAAALHDRELARLSAQLAELAEAPASPENVAALRALAKEAEAYRQAVEGSIPHTERLEALLKQIRAAEEGRGRQAQEERLRALREQARTLEENARAGIQVAEAFGLIDSAAAKALQAVAQLGASIFRIASGDMTAILPAIGSAAQLIGGMIDRTEDRERRRVMRENTRALERLARGLQDLSGLTGERGSVILGVAAAIDAAIARSPGSAFGIPQQILEEELHKLGLTMADAERIARQFGIQLDGTVASFRKLQEAMKGFELRLLFASTEGRLRMMELEERLHRIEDPVELLERRRQALLQEAGLSAADRATLEGFDLSTAAGQAAFQDFLLDLFRRLQTGEFTPEELGGLSVDQLLRLIEDVGRLVERSAEEFGETTGFQVVRTITEVTANRMIGTLTTISALIDMYGRATANNTAGILAALTGGRIPSIQVPGPTPPPPDGGRALPRPGPGQIGPNYIGPFHLAGTSKADAEEVGTAAGRAFAREINRHLAETSVDNAIAKGRQA